MALQHHTEMNTAVFLAEWPFKPVHAVSLAATTGTIALCEI
jgi:hypothetical protein